MDFIRGMVSEHNKNLAAAKRPKQVRDWKAYRKTHGYPRHPSKFEKANFLAWDGEGTQYGKRQVYSLLANSNRDYIFNAQGLSTEECLDFITDPKYFKNTIHVCFGASYDVNMMLRDLPTDLLLEIHEGDKFVRWGRFKIKYRPRKSFTVQRLAVEEKNGNRFPIFNKKTKRYVIENTITLWDVFGFFQKKFVSVLEEWTKGTEYEDIYKQSIRQIREGKEKRGNFRANQLQRTILPYCLKECEALRDIMRILQVYLSEAKLPLARWDGAGAVAASLLKREKVKQYIKIGDNSPEPQPVIDAFEHAYFGGWIEAFYFGIFECLIHHYDICSAYPSVMPDLDDMVHGKWHEKKYGNRFPLSDAIEQLKSLPSKTWVAHVEWKCLDGNAQGPTPFMWRNPHDRVMRPLHGRGWYCSHEILAAHKHFQGRYEFTIDHIFWYVSNSSFKPLSFVRDMYEKRKVLKELGRGVQIVYKLGLNSLYGKMAQSLGYNRDRGIKPPYHEIVWAALITSATRARLLDAAMQKPDSIISIATDGIYSLEPLDLPIGDELGEWEYTQHEKMVLVQPGFYWYWTKGVKKAYYRGFNEDAVTSEQVETGFQNDETFLEADVTRFVTLGAAIGLNDFSQWRTWRTVKRKLDLAMNMNGKRAYVGIRHPKMPDVRIAFARSVDEKLFVKHPEWLESKKYSYEWDDEWDGESIRETVEEMYHAELSPMDD